MRRVLALLAFVLALLIIPVASADGSWSIDLVAGQHTTIGTVDFIIVGDTLYANYNITSPGWCLETTHLYVDNVRPNRIAPGRFQYKHENLGCVTSDSFVVSLPEGDVFVAAHADTSFAPDNIDLSDLIGDSGTLEVNSVSSSYFEASVDVEGLASTYPAWCVDLEHFISTGVEYDVEVFESGSSLVDNRENLDLILYIINQDYSDIGAAAMDIQTAIWMLIDDITPFPITSAAEAIVADARENGEGFSPGCGDLMGVFMDAGPNIQNIMVVVPAPCIEEQPRSETAWALVSWGHEFGQGWGMYMQLVIASDDMPDYTSDSSSDDTPSGGTQGDTPVGDDPVLDNPSDNNNDNDNDNNGGNRSRRDEAPGQSDDKSPPGNRSDESRGNKGGN